MGSGNRTNHGVVFKPHNAFAVRFGSGIMDQEGFSRRREYIAKNLVKERLGAACDELRYCFTRHDFRRAGQRIERLGFGPLGPSVMTPAIDLLRLLMLRLNPRSVYGDVFPFR
jgi:hypothetical protein